MISRRAILFTALAALLSSLSFADVLTQGTPTEIIRHMDRLVESNEKPSASTIKTLGAYVKDESAAVLVRERAAWALGQLNARSEVDTLAKAAESKSLLVRSAALDSLAHMRARTGFDAYVKIAKEDPVLSMREKATVALGLLRWEKAIDPLVSLSDDPRLEVRGAAVLGMGATHSSKNDFREVLKDMTQDPEAFVASRAEFALDIANNKKSAIRPSLTHEDPNIRLFSALFFHYEGSEEDMASLKNAAASEKNAEVKYEMKQAIEGISKREQKKREEEERKRKEKAAREAREAAERAARQAPSAN